MRKPWTGPGLSPLQLYLREEHAALTFIAADLSDAAADAQRRLHALSATDGIGATVRRAQLSSVRKNLLITQQTLWQAVGRRIRAASPGVGKAAAEANRAMEEVLFRRAGLPVPEALVAAQQGYAQRTVLSYLARRTNHVPLSQQVYRSKALTNGWVDRTINRVILQGGSWKELADRVRGLIQPETPGGISYAAKRLARTELNNAFHTASVATSAQNPFTIGMTWHLSGSHPRVDRCDELARGHSAGRPAGVYDHAEVPGKPHPQCLCFVASVPMAEDDFFAAVLENPPASLAAATRHAVAS